MILGTVEFGWLAILIATPALGMAWAAIFRLNKTDKRIEELEAALAQLKADRN
jgi:hypothetical protein